MAKRKTYDTAVYQRLMDLIPGKWYPIDQNRTTDEYEKLLSDIRLIIDRIGLFELSPCFKKVQLLSEYRIQKISRGDQEDIVRAGRSILVEHSGTSYRIFKNDILISIET